MREALRLAAAVLVIHLVLVLPNHPAAATFAALRVFPLELPAILLALALVGARMLRATIAGGLAVMAAVKLADLAAYVAFGRPFNPYLDFHLVPAGLRMLAGAAGWPLAVAGLLGLVAAFAALTAALWWATGRIAALRPPLRVKRAMEIALLPALTLVIADAALWTREPNPPGHAFTSRLAWEHARDVAQARADLRDFRAEASRDPGASRPAGEMLAALRGTDVLLVFVESYGRAAISHPLYAPTITATLAEMEAGLAARGLAARSAYLTAPMVGGQSWLAHASVLSGLRIEDQGRYRALIASPRRTLLHFARDAGWRTVGVMPAISLAWPEAAYFGYDRVLAAGDLGYRGPAFNWVTMPDQFTLAAFERAELSEPARAPVFAEIALISSHAPWTPIPPLLPWEEIGDGRVYEGHSETGESPAELWRDLDLVRERYRQALDYSLRSVAAFLNRREPQSTLAIVLGDHQPARFVSLDPEGRDVPVHIIGPRELVDRLAPLGWTEGLLPAADAPVWGMEAFRDRFLDAFSAEMLASCGEAAAGKPLPVAGGC